MWNWAIIILHKKLVRYTKVVLRSIHADLMLILEKRWESNELSTWLEMLENEQKNKSKESRKKKLVWLTSDIKMK